VCWDDLHTKNLSRFVQAVEIAERIICRCGPNDLNASPGMADAVAAAADLLTRLVLNCETYEDWRTGAGQVTQHLCEAIELP
jgi:hypothetical protein